MLALFTAANITLSLGFLIYASWSDYKTREVSNRVWVIYAPTALSLSLAGFLLFDPSRLPFFVFSNGVLFAAATGVYMVFYNVLWHRRTGKKAFEGTLAAESVGKKLVAMITGHKVSVVKLKEKWHIYPMEDVEDESGANQPKRKLVVVPKDEGRDEIGVRLSKAVSSSRIDSYVL